MYSAVSVQVDSSHPLYGFCSKATHAANNLYNVALFTQRQVMFSASRPVEEWKPHEHEVMDRIAECLPAMNAIKRKTAGGDAQEGKEADSAQDTNAADAEEKKVSYQMPVKDKYLLSYEFLNAYLKVSKNPDYLCQDLSRQAAQTTIKEVTRTFRGFFSAIRMYHRNPDKFTGEPKLPGYLHSGGMHTVTFSNQDCYLYYRTQPKQENGEKPAKLIPAKCKAAAGNPKNLKLGLCFPGKGNLLDLGVIDTDKLMLIEVRITPFHGIFNVTLVLDDKEEHQKKQAEKKRKREAKEKGTETPSPAEETCTDEQTAGAEVPPKPLRAVNLDLGVENLISATNNIGEECLLFKGGIPRSINQWYNKRMAAIQSEQTKGTTNKFKPTPESDRLCIQRENRLSDFFHKAAKYLIQWCVSHEINTIVVGKNDMWKQKVDMGSQNNQTFALLPHCKLILMIEYLAKAAGIAVVRQEESYTSQASFLDGDPIPVYGEKGAGDVKFSGVRGPTAIDGRRKVQKKIKGTDQRKTTSPRFRGLYKTNSGAYLNSDLNASANIGRKAFPAMFSDGVQPDFTRFRIIIHPDKEKAEKIREQQILKNKVRPEHTRSKSAMRRDKRRASRKAG